MKRNNTNYWIYLGMMTVFCALIYFALCTGQHIDHSEVSSTVSTEMSSFELFKRIISDNLTNSLTILLLQIIVILITVRIFSFLFKYIGTFVAGIFLSGILCRTIPSRITDELEPVKPNRVSSVYVCHRTGIRFQCHKRQTKRNTSHQSCWNRGSLFSRSGSCHLGIRGLRGTASGIFTFCHVHRDKHEYHGLPRVGPDRAGT